MGELAEGIYETLRTVGLDRELEAVSALEARFAAVASAEAPEILARHVANVVRRALSRAGDEERALITDQVLGLLGADEDRLVDGTNQLVALTRPPTSPPRRRQGQRPPR